MIEDSIGEYEYIDICPHPPTHFFIYTHGAPKGRFLKGIREITNKIHCKELGDYHTLGFDTFGPFMLVGGVSKGHPTEEEITGAVRFYEGLK